MRNLKTLNNKTGRKIQHKLNSIISTHERYQKCYFWTNTGSASSRRSQEFETFFEFMLDGVHYTIDQSLEIPCKNFYYSCDIRKDGKKSNITAIKRLV